MIDDDHVRAEQLLFQELWVAARPRLNPNPSPNPNPNPNQAALIAHFESSSSSFMRHLHNSSPAEAEVTL